MDEQEKEIEEILRTFDKAPSPSSENSVQSHFSAIGGIYDWDFWETSLKSKSYEWFLIL